MYSSYSSTSSASTSGRTDTAGSVGSSSYCRSSMKKNKTKSSVTTKRSAPLKWLVLLSLICLANAGIFDFRFRRSAGKPLPKTATHESQDEVDAANAAVKEATADTKGGTDNSESEAFLGQEMHLKEGEHQPGALVGSQNHQDFQMNQQNHRQAQGGNFAVPGVPGGIGLGSTNNVRPDETDAPAENPPTKSPVTDRPTPKPTTQQDQDDVQTSFLGSSWNLTSTAAVQPCTPDSQVFQTSIYMTHKLNGTLNGTVNASGFNDDLMDYPTPPEIAEAASKLDLPMEDIVLMQELILETYNNMSAEYCDPYFCRLWSVSADNSTKRVFFTPDNETTQENPAVLIRLKYDLIGFCENLPELRLQGAFVFHQAATRSLGCFELAPDRGSALDLEGSLNASPSKIPSQLPSADPSRSPSDSPSFLPSDVPSSAPSDSPSCMHEFICFVLSV